MVLHGNLYFGAECMVPGWQYIRHVDLSSEKLATIGGVKALSWLLTMTVVALLWVFFRADSFGDSCAIIGHTFSDLSVDYIMPFATVRYLWLILMAVIIIAHCLPTSFWDKAAMWFVRSPWIIKLLIFIVVVQCVLQLRGEDVAPFIYFNF